MPSAILDRTKAFFTIVNDQDRFASELAKLTSEEFAYASISCEGKRLRVVHKSFNASYVRKFMQSQDVSCVRVDVDRRLRKLAQESPESRFASIYFSCTDSKPASKFITTLSPDFANVKQPNRIPGHIAMGLLNLPGQAIRFLRTTFQVRFSIHSNLNRSYQV